MIVQWFRRDKILLREISFIMKKRILAALTAIATLSLSITACTEALAEQTDPDGMTSSGTSRLKLLVTGNAGVKSSISPDECKISSICVMAYRKADGMLAAVQDSTSPEEIEMELACGRYNIYITANMDGFQAPDNESDLPSECYAIESFTQLGEALPMCWKGEAELKPGENTTIRADLSRLVSKTGLKIDMGTIKGLDIKSVRLRQGAGKIWPFMEGGSRIMDPSDAMDGDHASTEDISRLMAGETIWLYAAENCQGVLLPDNTDPWSKIPDNIGSAAELCTYIEVIGEWKGTSSYQGTVKYRFFLGEDTVSDFNVRRNSMNCITLYLEKGSFGKLNWKIDTSQMNPLNWNMSSTLANNYHDREDFYVTENIRVDFSFDNNGMVYWQNRNNSFIIAGIGANDKTVIRFGEPVNIGDGRFIVMGTCVDSGYYDIVLMDGETGEIKYYMEYGDVRVPEVVVGPPGQYSDTPVQECDREESLYINHGEAEVCLYLVDRNGYNINQSSYYGCDLTLPDWEVALRSVESGYDMRSGALIRIEVGETGNDGYAAKCTISMENDGMDEEWNRNLTESLGPGMIDIRFDDRFTETSCRTSMGLYCEDIDITLMCVPDQSRDHLQSEFMYAVDNSSNLPISIRGLKLNSMNGLPLDTDVRAIVCDEIPGFTSQIPLLISKMPYTYCSLETDSARHEIIGDKVCYAAEDNNLEQSQVPRQLAMFHTFEADLTYQHEHWSPEIKGNIDLYDTDGHRQTYGAEGYTNSGMAFHSGEDSHFLYDDNNGLKTDFREYGNLLDKEYISKFNDIIEVNFYINGNNEVTATSSRQVDLNISISGNLHGHIRCVTMRDPFFTLWGRYYTESVPFSNSQTFSLSSRPRAIDAGALADAFVTMRNIEYYSAVDSWDEVNFRVNNNNKGTIREYLKPYALDMSIEISSSDGTPIAVSFSGSSVYDYKTSKPVTWATGVFSTVTMVPSSYSDFDKGLEDNGCPPGDLFKAETVYLQPNLIMNTTQGIYYMAR